MCNLVDKNAWGILGDKIGVTYMIKRGYFLWDWDEAPKTKVLDEGFIYDWFLH